MAANKNITIRRSANKKFFIFVLVSSIACFAAAGTVLYLVLRPQILRIAVGPSGSDDVKLVQAMAQSFAREGDHIRLLPVITDGALQSVSMLRESKIDLAVSRSDLELPADAQSAAVLRKNLVVLWTPIGQAARNAKKPAGSEIKALDGLSGHKVGIVGGIEANATLLGMILSASGVSPDKVQIVQFAANEISSVIRDQTIDAFVAVGPLDSKFVVDAVAATTRGRGEPRFLGIETIDSFVQKHSLYQAAEIPQGTFGSSPARPDDKIDTVSFNHLIVARKSLSDEKVGAFTRQLLAIRSSLGKEFPGIANIEKPDTDKDAVIPAHRGAAAYIDGTERTFLERYSDYMWGALLLLSGLGSSGAWFRSYLKREEKTNNADLRDRLLAMISQVRLSNSLNEVDEMQSQVDEILIDTLKCYEDGAIQEGDLSAFGLILEQFHHAVTDRKTSIGVQKSA